MEIIPGVHRLEGVNGSNVTLLVDEQMAVVREAADKVVRHAREQCPHCRGLETVGMVLFESLSMCGDAGVKTLERVAHAGPDPLKPLAAYALAMV